MDTKLSGEQWRKIIGLPEDEGIIDERQKSEIDNSYIVLSNFGTVVDDVVDKVYNPASGISEEAFAAIIDDYCQRFDLDVINDLGDTFVLTGKEEAYAAISQEMDRRFSHAHTCLMGYEAMMKAEEEYAFDVAMGVHVPSEKRGGPQPTLVLDS